MIKITLTQNLERICFLFFWHISRIPEKRHRNRNQNTKKKKSSEQREQRKGLIRGRIFMFLSGL